MNMISLVILFSFAAIAFGLKGLLWAKEVSNYFTLSCVLCASNARLFKWAISRGEAQPFATSNTFLICYPWNKRLLLNLRRIYHACNNYFRTACRWQNTRSIQRAIDSPCPAPHSPLASSSDRSLFTRRFAQYGHCRDNKGNVIHRIHGTVIAFSPRRNRWSLTACLSCRFD